MTTEKDKLFDFRCCQWKSNAETLSRIKEDEIKWLLYAFGTFGAMISFMLGAAEIKRQIQEISFQYRFIALGSAVSVMYIFAMIWIGQALTYRQQYYRTMTRLLKAGMQIGEKAPASWIITENSY